MADALGTLVVRTALVTFQKQPEPEGRRRWWGVGLAGAIALLAVAMMRRKETKLAKFADGQEFDPRRYATLLETSLIPEATGWLAENGSSRQDVEELSRRREELDAASRVELLIEAMAKVDVPPELPGSGEIYMSLMTVAALHASSSAAGGSLKEAYLTLPEWLCDLFDEWLKHWNCD